MVNRQINKNLIVNIIAFAIQMSIGIFTAPMLIEALGTESYGFIGLANDCVNYLTIITTVFNSVAARFITFEMEKGDKEQAEKYFNSLFVTNVLLGIVFSIVGVIVVSNIDRIFEVPRNLLLDVKVTFSLTFITFILGVVTSIFQTAAFVKNRLDVQGLRNILQNVVRLICILVLLTYSQLHIYYISIGSLMAAITVAIVNFGIKNKYMPEVKLDVFQASIQEIKIVASAGIWMAITNLSSILMRGLDLVIANRFLGAYDMGLLSVARTFPNSYSAVVSTIVPIFTPVFIRYWARGENDALVSSICNSIKTMGLIMIVPISGFIVFSNTFYMLWQKSYSVEEVGVISLLSTITLLQCYFNSTTASMAQISVVVNKLRIPVLVSLLCGILNIIVVIFLLEYTNLGMYAIVSTSSIILILRYGFFNSFYCAKILNYKALSFYQICLKVWLTIPVQLVFLYLLKKIFVIRSWGTLIIAAIICGVIGYVLEWIMLEGKQGYIRIIERINIRNK